MQPQRILIFGKGQLGTAYREFFSGLGATVIVAEADVRDKGAVLQSVAESSPELVINAVAKTNIDWCEQHQEETFAVNVLGADAIAAACAESGAYLLHISSGCVQESRDANDIKTEEHTPDPLCFYAWTKVWAENLVIDRLRRRGLRALVLRPRQLLSARPSPRNALVKMLTYTEFIDTPNSCTVIEDLMTATRQLLEKDAVGVINVVNPGVTSPYRIAQLLKDHVKPEMTIAAIAKDELNRKTLARRIDAVLSTAKLEALGVRLKPLDERLPEIMAELKRNLSDGAATAIMAQAAQETREKLALAQAPR